MSKKGKAFRVKGSLLVAIIGDEPTVTGFLLTGIGERNRKGEANFLVVTKDTTQNQIETAFKKMLERDDIGIIMISQHVAEMVRNIIVEHEEVIPTIMEIPSKDFAYEPEKDTILTRAARILYGNEIDIILMEDTQSLNSKTSSTNEKSVKSRKNTDKNSSNDKKVMRVLKNAVKEYKEKSEQLEKELKRVTERNDELESELQDKDQKYLHLYSENDQLHQQISHDRSEKEKQKDQWVQEKSEYETKMKDLQFQLQKAARDMQFQEEEMKSLKKIARELAGEHELKNQRDAEWQEKLNAKDDELEEEKHKVKELQKQIQAFKQEINEQTKSTLKTDDLRLEFEAHIEKKDEFIQQLSEEILKYKDELKGKDQAIKALSQTILDKGDENQKLLEMVGQFKNQLLKSDFYNQRYAVQRLDRGKAEDMTLQFVRDKSTQKEYFLELCDAKGYKKRIPITDIEEIEPVQGKIFNINIYQSSLTQDFLSQFTKKAGGSIKQEQYQSRHIAEILDAYQSLLKQLVDDEEEEQREQEEYEKLYAEELQDSEESQESPDEKKVKALSSKIKNKIMPSFAKKPEPKPAQQVQAQKKQKRRRNISSSSNEDSYDDEDSDSSDEEKQKKKRPMKA